MNKWKHVWMDERKNDWMYEQKTKKYDRDQFGWLVQGLLPE